MGEKREYVVKRNVEEDALSGWLKSFSFEIHAFGHQHDNPKAECDFRVVGDYELIYVVGGRSMITVGEKEHVLHGGEMILIPPFTRHQIRTDAMDPHDNYWIHFDVFPFYRQREFLELLQKGIDSEQFRRNVNGVKEKLSFLYGQMEENIRGKEIGKSYYCELLFVQIILQVLRCGGQETDGIKLSDMGRSAEADIVDRGMQYIREHLEGVLKVQDICAHLHISESGLYKAFSEVVGLTPNYLIRIYKLKRAEQLMQTTSYTIREISELLGFSSPYYFSTVFKNHYGVSPHYYFTSDC